MAVPRPETALRTFVRRMSRHASIYATGNITRLVLALVFMGVLTRYFPPGQFGRYALLMIFSTSVTLVLNMGSLQGALSWVAGQSGGDEEGLEDEDPDKPGPRATDRRRALGTAIVLTVGIAIVGTVAVVLTAAPVAGLLLGDSSETRPVVLAGAAGAVGAVWRLASYLPRLERRAVSYTLLSLLRPVLTIGTSIVLVAAGGGLEGAITGLLLGNVASAAVALLVCRRQYRLAFKAEDARAIMVRGAALVPVVMCFWIVQHFDLFLLSFYSADEDVALYRVASRIGQGILYALTALLMAWGPLLAEPLGQAVKAEREPQAANAALLTYFFLAAVALLTVFSLSADLLVRIAAPAYEDAALLLPLIGLGFVLNGTYVATYRTVRFPNKKRTYRRSALLCLMTFAAVALPGIPRFGAYGAAASVAAAFAAGTALLLVASQRGPEPLPFRYRQLLGVPTLAVGLLAVSGVLSGDHPRAALLGVGGLVIAAMLLGVLPRTQIRTAASLAAAFLPRRSMPGLSRRLRSLPSAERELLRRTVNRRDPGSAEPEGLRSVVSLLRRLSDLSPREEIDELDEPIARYVLSREPVHDRDEAARQLIADGADPLELDRLSLTVTALRRLRSADVRVARRWRRAPARVDAPRPP